MIGTSTSAESLVIPQEHTTPQSITGVEFYSLQRVALEGGTTRPLSDMMNLFLALGVVTFWTMFNSNYLRREGTEKSSK